jgi:hypothetical protein
MSTEEIACEATPRTAGEFRGQFNLFVADPYTREIIVDFRGKANGAKGPKSGS